jgi:hypothetical protein
MSECRTSSVNLKNTMMMILTQWIRDVYNFLVKIVTNKQNKYKHPYCLNMNRNDDDSNN